MHAPKVSVIMPVYNSEKWLGRSLGSLAAQTFTDFEAIVVDDRSTDGSLSLINEYASRDECFKPIALSKNGGAGNARNIGIESAKGEYLAFLDADDAYAPDFLERLYKKAVDTGADIIKGSCLDVFRNGIDDKSGLIKMRYQNNSFVEGVKNGKRLFLIFDERHFSAIYRRRFIIDNNLRYGRTAVGEDSTFLLKAGTAADSVAYDHDAIYYYYYNESSLSHSCSNKRLDGIIDSFREQIDFIENAGIDRADAVPYTKRRLKSRLKVHSVLRLLENREADAEQYKKGLYEVVSGCSFAYELGESDYAIDVFFRSGGKENITLSESFVLDLYDRERHFEDLNRLVKHLAGSPFRSKNGMSYLANRITYLYSNLSLTAARSLQEHKAVITSAMHEALKELNTPELLSQMDICTRALVEYGTIIGLTVDEEAKITAKTTLEFLTNAVNMLAAHKNAASEYVAYAENLSEKLMRVVVSNSKTKIEGAEMIKSKTIEITDMLNTLKKSRQKRGGESMTQPKISVIIPVYNAEAHIVACLDSILAQTFSDIEVIAVDDCSTDASAEILAEYQNKDGRLRVLRTEANSGQGTARNIGIENAEGDYLSFVDADDLIAPDFLERLYGTAIETGADIIKGLAHMVKAGDSVVDKDAYSIRPINSIIKSIPKRERGKHFCFSYEHWSAIYKRNFIIQNGIRYGTSRISQDTTFLIRAAAYVPKIELNEEAVYYYMQREGSTIHKYDLKRFYDSLDALSEQIDFINAKEVRTCYGHLLSEIRNALGAHSYLCTRISKAESDAYLKRVYSVVSRSIYIDKLSNDDFAVGAFIRSGGVENISVGGRVIGIDDNTEWNMGAIERFVGYINHNPEKYREGLQYLETAISDMYYYAFGLSYEDIDERYRALSEKLRSILLGLEGKNEPPYIYCLKEYGVDIFPHNTLTVERRKNHVAALIEQVHRINAFLEEYGPQHVYITCAKHLRDKAFKFVGALLTETTAERAELLVKLAEETKKLSDIEKVAQELNEKNE